MAVSPVRKRYTSAVYDDKFFPEKNATIPFKWETAPGRPKFDDEDGDNNHHYVHAEEGNSIKEPMVSMPTINNEQYYTKKDDELQSTNTKKDDKLMYTQIPHAVSIYPLRPPPKLSPASPLRVKDLLRHSDACDYCFHDDHHCPLHAHHHGFPWFIRFWPLKASAIVPLHKSYCVFKPQHRIIGMDNSQASPLINTSTSLQCRSQSFSHAAGHSSGKQLSGVTGASKRVSERRCNSFNSLSVPHHTILEHDEDNEHYDSPPSIATAAAAAMWAGACILAAVAVDNHHINEPCKVASKLRDLMQQSANFSELGLGAPLATSGRATLTPTKRRTKSMEEEVVEAFLKEGMQKSYTNEKCGGRHLEHTKDGANLAVDGFDFQPSHQKHARRKGFFTLFKNECIACWCPSSTY